MANELPKKETGKEATEQSGFMQNLREMVRKFGVDKVAAAIGAFLAVESGTAHADQLEAAKKPTPEMINKLKAEHPDIAKILNVAETASKDIQNDDVKPDNSTTLAQK